MLHRVRFLIIFQLLYLWSPLKTILCGEAIPKYQSFFFSFFFCENKEVVFLAENNSTLAESWARWPNRSFLSLISVILWKSSPTIRNRCWLVDNGCEDPSSPLSPFPTRRLPPLHPHPHFSALWQLMRYLYPSPQPANYNYQYLHW